MLKSDIDIIYCALPNHLHYSFSKKALEAGKHVIIEKPVTANAKELEDLIEYYPVVFQTIPLKHECYKHLNPLMLLLLYEIDTICHLLCKEKINL